MNLHSSTFSKILFPILLAIVSYFTLLKDYSKPPFFFWDENYHIAAAQKYLNGIFFMEPHPPLGKLLIALGEYLLRPNLSTNQFLQTDHAPTTPPKFSFAGYRLIPAILAFFCPLLLYAIVRVFASNVLAFFIGLLFALDNALVVHLRGAMLEGIQLFFALSFILGLAVLIKHIKEDSTIRDPLISWLGVICGLTFGCVMTTKLNGIVLVCLLIPTLIVLIRNKKWVLFLGNFSASFFILFFAVWGTHIALGARVEPKLPNSGYYQASPPYRQHLSNPDQTEIGFMDKLRDQLLFVQHYTNGVPELNYCKKEENGSPWYWWPFGGKSINYRWEKKGELTSFLYLVINPVGWFISLSAVLISAIVIGSSFFFKPIVKNQSLAVIGTLFLSWLLYLGIFGSLGRVMYLYHYFIPLILGWLMLPFVIKEVTHLGPISLNSRNKSFVLTFLVMAQTLSFIFFSPLTYARGITNDELRKRSLFNIWDLRCVNCSSLNPLARPLGDPKRSVTANIPISGLRAVESYQEWGEPKINVSVTGEPLVVNGVSYASGLGVHAESRLVFILNKKKSSFSAKVALPDYLIPKNSGSVIFRVLGDGNVLWTSPDITPKLSPALPVSVNVSGIQSLTLEVLSAGDGNNNDHALWLEPKFE